MTTRSVAVDILTGFLAPDERFSYGRPVGVAIGPTLVQLMCEQKEKRAADRSDPL